MRKLRQLFLLALAVTVGCVSLRHPTVKSVAKVVESAGYTNCTVVVRDDNAVELDFGRSFVSDLSFLAELPLYSLTVREGHEISSLAPLRDMPLRKLHLQHTNVSDLQPLQGMQLELLILQFGESIRDISPLAGMPLSFLCLDRTNVGDLSPLSGMPLKVLHVQADPVTNLSALAGLPLERLEFLPTKSTGGLDVVRQMKSINRINGKDADLFWKLYDRGIYRYYVTKKEIEQAESTVPVKAAPSASSTAR